MGIFLVFFPEEKQLNSPTINSILKRTNSSHISTKTQSTISICALLIFLTFLLFTLSSFEPNNNDFMTSSHRRFLTQTHRHFHTQTPPIMNSYSQQHALQGLGTLYARGTTAMNELVICHVTSHVTKKELKLFMKAFHRSGLPSKSDLLFIFDSGSSVGELDDVIREENDIFLKLVDLYKQELGNGSKAFDFPVSFDLARFVKPGSDPDKGEPIWGRRVRTNNSTFGIGNGESKKTGFDSSQAGKSGSDPGQGVKTNNSSIGFSENGTESTRTSHGSVVGFGVGELDPENALSGFVENARMSLRRWATYPMILGRVRRKFKKIILVDAKEVLLLGDPFGRVKNHSPESIFLFRKNKKGHKKAVNPVVILGGERGVRRLSAAMLTEIVRSTTHQHRNKKGSLTESGLLSQLIGNEFLAKSIRFVTSELTIPEPSSLSGVEITNQTVVLRRGNSNLDIGEVIMKHICSFSIDSSVYTEC
uniref:uncharacterized protein LOC122581193 n=1 Tax=Erigeron canadensis TaxID=72917 RepID=UPI001CB9A6F9|nr:uncharacterized protein LOC122581193 [Erigeron canadensis]